MNSSNNNTAESGTSPTSPTSFYTNLKEMNKQTSKFNSYHFKNIIHYIKY